MIGEGIIALVWATLSIAFYHDSTALNTALDHGAPTNVVKEISTSLLGLFSGLLAIIGVIILPIPSGDTAFRSARLIIANVLKVNQRQPSKRLLLAVPLFVVGFLVSKA